MSVSQAVGAFGASALVFWLGASGLGSIADSYERDHESRAALRHLSIAQLYYEEVDGKGRVVQQIVPTNGEIIPAAWNARIERKRADGSNSIVCEGGGDGNYNGKVDIWSLDDWTADDCPDVAQPGDIFEVSWTYQNGFGFVESIGGRFVLQSDGTLELTE